MPIISINKTILTVLVTKLISYSVTNYVPYFHEIFAHDFDEYNKTQT